MHHSDNRDTTPRAKHEGLFGLFKEGEQYLFSVKTNSTLASREWRNMGRCLLSSNYYHLVVLP